MTPRHTRLINLSWKYQNMDRMRRYTCSFLMLALAFFTGHGTAVATDSDSLSGPSPTPLPALWQDGPGGAEKPVAEVRDGLAGEDNQAADAQDGPGPGDDPVAQVHDDVDEGSAQQLVRLSWSGFVRTDYWMDSRTVVQAREALFNLYPENVWPDDQGKDIYGDPVFNYSAIATRFTARMDGPDAFGARVWALVEADFTGVTNDGINQFRLRHAYVQMEWTRWGLMLGQYWHPLFSAEVIPTVVSLNTGVPFQPFIRNPLATLTYRYGQSRWMFSLVGQRDNASDGPGGPSPDYLRTAKLPNAHIQWTGFYGNGIVGLGADYKRIRPRLQTDTQRYTDEYLGSFALLAYAAYQNAGWELKAKSIYGQNLSEHLMMGGYAESLVDGDGYVSYTPLNHLSVWTNVLYGERIRPGLFLGFNRNLGAGEEVQGHYYGRGSDIAYVYRIAPSLTFRSGSLELCTEFEYTAAAYGEPDSRGMVRDHSEVANVRMLFTAVYYF